MGIDRNAQLWWGSEGIHELPNRSIFMLLFKVLSDTDAPE
jgi:hypothetical protein